MAALLVIEFLMFLFEGLIFQKVLKSSKTRWFYRCVRMGILAYILIVALISATHILLRILYVCGVFVAVYYLFKFIINIFTKKEV